MPGCVQGSGDGIDCENDKRNHSSIKEFILTGLGEDPHQIYLFLLFFYIYIITVSGNLCIILVYNMSLNLHNPMYFNLANFSFIEICYVSVIVPKMLSNFLVEHKSISFYGCSAQMYFAFLFGGVECYVLASMAYDRYIAICHPLLYNAFMNRSLCIWLLAGSWFIGAANALVHNVLTFTLPFYGTNRINHFFCDVPALLKLACIDTWINEVVLFAVSGCVIIGSFILIMLSYIRIILMIFNIHSRSGRKKAFSTCSSHLTVVTIFYGSVIFMYFRPKSSYSQQDCLASIMYTIIAPLLNPFIYSLKNTDVKVALVKLIKTAKHCYFHHFVSNRLKCQRNQFG
uniref:Olfactory receptor n=1 Tax=Leptobrachium leishanense TaxID=445787 RepID=A0A8C5N1Y4_9ANUR